MSATVAARLLWGLCLALAGVGLLLFALNGDAARLIEASVGVKLAVAITYPTVGALIAARRPGNRIGWLFCAVGVAEGIALVAREYAQYALVTRPGALPAGLAAAWLGSWARVPGAGLAGTLLLLLFPTGRLPSPRWRPVAWLAFVGLLAVSVTVAIAPWDQARGDPAGVNPLARAASEELLMALRLTSVGVLIVGGLGCLIALLRRFRRARGLERQQLTWFTLAGGLYLVTLLAPVNTAALQIVIHPCLPIAVGVAILRHRLYDIDVIIRRTALYAALTATLAAVYFGGVVLLQAAFRAVAGQESDLAIVASTLAVAALFLPLRRRLQGVIDRRFHRRRYDAAGTLAAFSAMLRDEVDLDKLTDELARVADATMEPAHVSVWLRSNDDGDTGAAPLASAS